MPFGDRTGPRGEGPRTGRGLGHCSGFESPGYVRGTPGGGRGFGRGQGRGFGPGRGFGRGYGFAARRPAGYWGPHTPGIRTKEEAVESEKEYLANEIDAMEEELEAMKEKMEELKETKREE